MPEPQARTRRGSRGRPRRVRQRRDWRGRFLPLDPWEAEYVECGRALLEEEARQPPPAPTLGAGTGWIETGSGYVVAGGTYPVANRAYTSNAVVNATNSVIINETLIDGRQETALSAHTWNQWTATTPSWTPHPRTVQVWEGEWQENRQRRRDPKTGRVRPMTALERGRMEFETRRQALINKNRRRAAELRRRVAARRAERLLLECLDESQAAEWRENKRFHVETADGTRVYRIQRGRAGNIYLVKDGDREADPGGYLRRYCFHVFEHRVGLRAAVPDEDNVLVQKFAIESDEEQFLRVANRA